MRIKLDAHRTVATVNCIAYKASASAWGCWLPRTGLDFDYNRAGSIPLTQTKGSIYDLPDSADLSRYDALVIYCARFHVAFGMANFEKF